MVCYGLDDLVVLQMLIVARFLVWFVYACCFVCLTRVFGAVEW